MRTNLQRILQDSGSLRPDALLRFTPEFVADTLTAADLSMRRAGSSGRAMIEQAIEELIGILDRLDGDPEAEDDGSDLEADDDCEDDADFEDEDDFGMLRGGCGL